MYKVYSVIICQTISKLAENIISINVTTLFMLENIAYVGLGFVTVFLALEAAWHFTACKIHDKSIKPCFYKQIGILK